MMWKNKVFLLFIDHFEHAEEEKGLVKLAYSAVDADSVMGWSGCF